MGLELKQLGMNLLMPAQGELPNAVANVMEKGNWNQNQKINPAINKMGGILLCLIQRLKRKNKWKKS